LDDSVRTILLIALGVGLLYLGSWIRRRSLRSRPPRQGPGPDGR
jgi:hypothetical protein